MTSTQKRLLKRLNLSISAEQEGISRFPRTRAYDKEIPIYCRWRLSEERDDGDISSPPISFYRNNLTALSQRYNYLFIAYSSEIRVYQPEFPAQNVPRSAILTFELPYSGQGLRGYINPSDAHAINHMIIGDIGNQETLLAACDDGDIVAISTHLIHQAVQMNLEAAHSRLADQPAGLPPAGEIRAFFTGNVGASAWGLAIHSEARLFAVSANTHDITIFAFALGGHSSEDSSSDAEEDVFEVDIEDIIKNADWNDLDGPPAPGQRASQNLQIVLKGHLNNIPNIAFCNTDADPEGRYLVSTDIELDNFVWDIWQQKDVGRFNFREGSTSFEDRWKRKGWGVACLDPFAFRSTETRAQTLGGMRNPKKKESYGVEYDITASVEHIPEAATNHPAMSEIGIHASEILSTLIVGDDFGVDEDDSDGSSEEADMEDEVDQSNGAGVTLPPTDPQSIPRNSTTVTEWTDAISPLFENGNGTRTRQPSSPSSNASRLRPPPRHTPRQQAPGPKNVDIPFHILHTSMHDMCLLAEGDLTRVLCKSALDQTIPPRLRMLTTFERMNMIHQIPELGVVVVASQAGRIAVLTLTKMRRSKPPLSGFRIDWILPLESQEARGIRPEAPLMGIAVSPIQGQENWGGLGDEGSAHSGRSLKSAMRKHRIMLIYAEHTVLSYEIERPTNNTGYEVDDRVVLL